MIVPSTRLTRPTTRRPHADGGFTIIEMMAVIAIMAVLAATAVPAMTYMDDTRSAMAGKQLLRDLTFARQHAIATGATTWVVFDTGAETWELLAEDLDNPGRVNAAVMTDAATGGSYVQTLGAGSFVNVGIDTAAFDGDVEVGFDWLGRPFNAAETALAAQGAVTLSGGNVVTVEMETGHATYVAP